MNKPNKTLIKLEELQKQKSEVNQQLATWTEKFNQAEKFSQVLYETRTFTTDFWNQRIKEARENTKKEMEFGANFPFSWLELELARKTEFGIYYQALGLFDQEITKQLEIRKNKLDLELSSIDDEITKLETRLNNRKSTPENNEPNQ